MKQKITTIRPDIEEANLIVEDNEFRIYLTISFGLGFLIGLLFNMILG